MPSLPPQPRDAERQLRQPDEREAQHPEQHPGADPSRGDSRMKRCAVARVERQHDEQRDVDSTKSIRRKRS